MTLGLSAEEAGMDHMEGAAILERMRDREVRSLAEDIIAAQKREIEAMRAFRERKYGGPVPAVGPGQQHR